MSTRKECDVCGFGWIEWPCFAMIEVSNRTYKVGLSISGDYCSLECLRKKIIGVENLIEEDERIRRQEKQKP